MEGLSQALKRKLKDKFNEMDEDFSGYVSLLEMARYFDKQGVNVSESALKVAFQEAGRITGTVPSGEFY